MNHDFWDVLAAFRTKPGNADAGFGSMTIKHKMDGSCGKWIVLPSIAEDANLRLRYAI
jgi:hypothetical protein